MVTAINSKDLSTLYLAIESANPLAERPMCLKTTFLSLEETLLG